MGNFLAEKTNQLNQHLERSSVFWPLVLVSLGGLGLELWWFYPKVFEPDYPASSYEAPSSLDRVALQQPLFGRAQAEAVLATMPDKSLRLLGVMYSVDSQSRSAIVVYKDKARSYQEGERITPHIVIARIERAQVIVTVSGKEYVLTLPKLKEE